MVRQAHHERIIFPLSLSLSKAVRTMSGNKAALREILRPDVASGLSMTLTRVQRGKRVCMPLCEAARWVSSSWVILW